MANFVQKSRSETQFCTRPTNHFVCNSSIFRIYGSSNIKRQVCHQIRPPGNYLTSVCVSSASALNDKACSLKEAHARHLFVQWFLIYLSRPSFARLVGLCVQLTRQNLDHLAVAPGKGHTHTHTHTHTRVWVLPWPPHCCTRQRQGKCAGPCAHVRGDYVR